MRTVLADSQAYRREYGGTGYNPNEPVCRKSRTVRIIVDGRGVNPVANTVRKQKIAGNYI